MKCYLIVCCVFLTVFSTAQSNFTYSPQKPQPGDEVSFTYTPAGDLAGMVNIPDAFIVQSSKDENTLTDSKLSRAYGKLEGKFTLSTNTVFVAIGFTKEGKYGVNNDQGYFIQVYKGDKPVAHSSAMAAQYYEGIGKRYFKILNDFKKAQSYYEDEFMNYPQNYSIYQIAYFKDIYKSTPLRGIDSIQKNIEKLIGNLQTEADYNQLIKFYSALNLSSQKQFIENLKLKKYKAETSELVSLYQKYLNQKDWTDKKNYFLQSISSSNKKESYYDGNIWSMGKELAIKYLKDIDLAQYNEIIQAVKDKSIKYRIYQEVILHAGNDKGYSKLKEQMAKEAVLWAKKEWSNPVETQPKMTPRFEWDEKRKDTYATYAAQYATVLFNNGKYKEGYPFAKEAARMFKDGNNGQFNNLYLQLAQKVLPAKEVKDLAEKTVIENKSGDFAKNMLKELYVKQQKTEDGFDAYIENIKTAAKNKKLESLRKEILNTDAPAISLRDTDGKLVNLSDYAGKVVVLDFWATWCGPCKASFPSMQKMVTHFKDDPEVKFLFIDTWEQREDKLTPVLELVQSNNYTFHVLMDDDHIAIRDYRVAGIPAKYIIGKDGKIKFKEAGFYGEKDLLEKLPMMIQLAGE